MHTCLTLGAVICAGLILGMVIWNYDDHYARMTAVGIVIAYYFDDDHKVILIYDLLI